MKATISLPGLLAGVILLLATPAKSDISELTNGFEAFRHNLFSQLVDPQMPENIIFSPFSIHTSLAMVRMGSNGTAANELDRKLGFTGQTPENVADNFHDILAKYQDSQILKIANKVYVMQGYALRQQFKEQLANKFFSLAENINFGDNVNASAAMNAWIESKTNKIIKDLVHKSDVSSDTRLVLLNAIHFKGEWIKPFVATEEADFYIDDNHSIKVQMMTKYEFLPYYEFPALDAAAIRMRYRKSDISMWIFLPNSRSGLSELENKLSTFKLGELTKEMAFDGIHVNLPKFKVEYEIELSTALEKMGITEIFGDADFSKMLKSPEPLSVSKVIHKAVIDVNEIGTEGSAATAILFEPHFGFSLHHTFNADHPFYYVIATNDFVPLFQGTFVGI